MSVDDTNKALLAILEGTVAEVVEVLSALSSDDLGVLIQAERGSNKPRSGVIDAITKDRAGRVPTPEEDAPEEDAPEEDAPEEDAAPITVTNASKNRHRVNHIELAPGESHTLSADDVKDERLMLKVNRALEIGVLTHGAD